MPNEISVKVDAITRRIEDTLGRADALGPGSYAQFVLAKSATDYLPDTLDAYLASPRRMPTITSSPTAGLRGRCSSSSSTC